MFRGLFVVRLPVTVERTAQPALAVASVGRCGGVDCLLPDSFVRDDLFLSDTGRGLLRPFFRIRVGWPGGVCRLCNALFRENVRRRGGLRLPNRLGFRLLRYRPVLRFDRIIACSGSDDGADPFDGHPSCSGEFPVHGCRIGFDEFACGLGRDALRCCERCGQPAVVRPEQFREYELSGFAPDESPAAWYDDLAGASVQYASYCLSDHIPLEMICPKLGIFSLKCGMHCGKNDIACRNS